MSPGRTRSHKPKAIRGEHEMFLETLHGAPGKLAQRTSQLFLACESLSKRLSISETMAPSMALISKSLGV